MEKEKQCSNCTHFMAHYIKFDSKFHLIDGHGHCLCRKPSGHARKTDKICECFEEKDLKEEIKEEVKSATELLTLISERLGNLTQIFKLLIQKSE